MLRKITKHGPEVTGRFIGRAVRSTVKTIVTPSSNTIKSINNGLQSGKEIFQIFVLAPIFGVGIAVGLGSVYLILSNARPKQ
jgi:hypothetical protein